MQLQSDKMWSEEELKDLIQYTQYLRQENEDLQAKMIMMQAKLNNEEAKVKRLGLIIQNLTYGQAN